MDGEEECLCDMLIRGRRRVDEKSIERGGVQQRAHRDKSCGDGLDRDRWGVDTGLEIGCAAGVLDAEVENRGEVLIAEGRCATGEELLVESIESLIGSGMRRGAVDSGVDGQILQDGGKIGGGNRGSCWFRQENTLFAEVLFGEVEIRERRRVMFQLGDVLLYPIAAEVGRGEDTSEV